jgi:hypothetical protein
MPRSRRHSALPLKLIMKIGPLPDAGRTPARTGTGFHCARTHWIRGFMAFQSARGTRTVILMVPE